MWTNPQFLYRIQWIVHFLRTLLKKTPYRLMLQRVRQAHPKKQIRCKKDQIVDTTIVKAHVPKALFRETRRDENNRIKDGGVPEDGAEHKRYQKDIDAT